MADPDIVASLRYESKHGTYPLPPVVQPGYMFKGRAVVIDSATLDAAADEIERLRAARDDANDPTQILPHKR